MLDRSIACDLILFQNAGFLKISAISINYHDYQSIYVQRRLLYLLQSVMSDCHYFSWLLIICVLGILVGCY